MDPVLRIRDVYPGTRILIFTHPRSRISDPGSKTATKERGEKIGFICTFSVATNFTKLKIILFLKCWRKKFLANFQRIIELTQKIVTSQKFGVGVRDARSGIRKKPIPDLGVKKAPDPDPQHWMDHRSKRCGVHITFCRGFAFLLFTDTNGLEAAASAGDHSLKVCRRHFSFILWSCVFTLHYSNRINLKVAT